MERFSCFEWLLAGTECDKKISDRLPGAPKAKDTPWVCFKKPRLERKSGKFYDNKNKEYLKIYGLNLYGGRIEDGRIILCEEGLFLEVDGNLEERHSNQNVTPIQQATSQSYNARVIRASTFTRFEVKQHSTEFWFIKQLLANRGIGAGTCAIVDYPTVEDRGKLCSVCQRCAVGLCHCAAVRASKLCARRRHPSKTEKNSSQSGKVAAVVPGETPGAAAEC